MEIQPLAIAGPLEVNELSQELSTLTTEEDVSGSILGHCAKSLDEIYDIYCHHARMVGFSVRKNTTRIGNNNVVVEKYYVCSYEGFQRQKNKSKQVSSEDLENVKGGKKFRKNLPTRTGCNASIRVKLNGEGMYEVISHVIEHNHPLTKKDLGHLLRSERNISKEKGEIIESLHDAGIKAIDSFRYLCNSAGGEEVVGHTVKDHYNFIHRLKMSAIEAGDAQSLIDLLNQENVDDSDFFYRVRLDCNARLAHIFWRDSRMKEDYKIFGDVVVFDTTYRTNRYNLICAPFVGINNHWKNVMFGCAFLSDEKIESFQWLLETFKKAMEGVCPTTIFTDQDHAMANAIESVFPQTRHRLCLWHLQKNAVSHFGVLKRDREFKDYFNKCLRGCSTIEEFETCWKTMIEKYNLQNETWFTHLYTLKEKWCTTLSKDFFSAGILSSQRSESTNYAISFRANKTTSLTEFYKIFNETVKRWRSRENNDDFRSSRPLPNPKTHMNGLLRHAFEVYTLTLFDDFENEFNIAMCSVVKQVDNLLGTLVYHVFIENNDTNDKHVVCFTPNDGYITCSCKHFEEVGMLCYHCIRVMHMHSVVRIPDVYISKRWRKDAKDQYWKPSTHATNEIGKVQKHVQWRHSMARRYYNLILKCEQNDEARNMIEDVFRKLTDESNILLAEKDRETEESTTTTPIRAHIVFDPERAKTKGRVKRKKGHFERRKGGSSDTINSTTMQEFGTVTPNPKLF